MRTVAQKMGIRENGKTYFKNAPGDAIEALKLPDVELGKELTGEFDYIHVFVKHQSEQVEFFRN